MIEYDEESFKESMAVVTATPEGKIIFAWLRDALGWESCHVNLENNNANVYDMTRRNIYGGLRKFISRDSLKDIEFNHSKKAVKNERSGRSDTTTRTKPTK
jgi:hypothetical protein